MEMPAKQTPAASSEMVKLIRKLRWVGLEEKAEQLEKELEQHAVTDTVVSIQNETDCQDERLSELLALGYGWILRHARSETARGDS